MTVTDYDIKTEPAESIKSLHGLLDTFEKQVLKLQELANIATGKVQKIQQCSNMGKVMSSIASYNRSKYIYDSQPSCETICKKAMEDADARLEEDRKVHEANIPLIEANIQLRNKIKEIMENAGIPSSYSESHYKSSRSRSPTYQTIKAGWALDLDRVVCINDNWEQEKRYYEDFKRKVEEYRKQVTAEEQAKLKAKEQEEKKIIEQRELAVMVLKYNLPPASTWKEVMDCVLGKDKYLRLAHYLSLNRGDWNDGCTYAENGILNFKIEGAIDEQISECIQSCMGENWDGDGRIFRDCEWNYDRIFGMVTDKGLMDDYGLINGRISY